MNRIAATMLLLCFSRMVPVAAQTTTDNNISPGVRLYQPAHMDATRASRVAAFVQSVTESFVSWEPALEMISIRVRPPGNSVSATAQLDRAEALLKRFDVPAPPDPQFEFTVYLIRAYTDSGGEQHSVPSELAGVVKEMKGSLNYTGFALVDTILATVRHFTKLENVLTTAVTRTNAPVSYSLEINQPSATADGKTVTVQQFHFNVKVPVSNTAFDDRGIATDLAIHEGQTVVLGKIKLYGADHDDLWLAVTAKVK